MKKKVHIHTFGCQMNVHDSEKMSGILKAEGYAEAANTEDADLIIFNTCSIRQKAEQKFRSELGRIKLLKSKNPLLKIAVAGCIAQQRGRDILKRNPHVDYVFGPQNIHKLSAMLTTNAMVCIEDNPEIQHTDLPAERKENLKAWISIMYGCNNFCSYCIVPYTRGRERSRPSQNIYEEIHELADKGFKEVTLLGQNVNSYNSDTNFPGLLRKIEAIKGVERIRFVTSHPRDLSDELISCIKELPKICEHIHLPLQSGSGRILKLMNRGYTYEDYIEKVRKLKESIPSIAITTDIITGFPSETDNDHSITIKALRSIEFDGIFAFKFSSRQGTKAAEMDGEGGRMAEKITSQRLSEILGLQDDITLRKNEALKGTLQEVLVEGASKTDKGKITGRTRTNKIVNFEGNESVIGRLVNVEIRMAMRHSLEGRLTSQSQ
ncbi:MAG: tRNA (N6-isopentenyl adenosine(37)-C2)-methylthiotransferase MiaB [Nitrospirae bacterium]|nr:tRNA (N6-isopentenyl adenosine(37)-C2)-methylthiotransferase MiaB [Nitrospirota bacterium]